MWERKRERKKTWGEARASSSSNQSADEGRNQTKWLELLSSLPVNGLLSHAHTTNCFSSYTSKSMLQSPSRSLLWSVCNITERLCLISALQAYHNDQRSISFIPCWCLCVHSPISSVHLTVNHIQCMFYRGLDATWEIGMGIHMNAFKINQGLQHLRRCAFNSISFFNLSVLFNGTPTQNNIDAHTHNQNESNLHP